MIAVVQIGAVIGIALNGANNASGGVVVGTILATIFLYYLAVVFAIGSSGRSVGKLIFGLRVVDAKTLRSAGLPSAALRCLLLALTFFWIWTLALLITALTPNATTGVARALHDRAAGTEELDVRRGADPVVRAASAAAS